MCTTGTIGYPILAPNSITQTIYDGLRDTFPIEFKFKARNSLPIFSTPATATIDEPSQGSPAPTITYNELVYTLSRAQIVAASNKSFMLTNQSSTIADFVLTFQTDYAIPATSSIQKYIFVVIPLIQQDSSSTGESPYFRALSGQSVDGQVSLDQCLPAQVNREFVCYSTCLNPNSVRTLVMIFRKGCLLSSTTLTKLGASTFGISGGTVWPTFIAPTDTILAGPMTFTLEQFNSSVVVSTLSSKASTGSATSRINNVNNYTCVPLDPDLDILGGKLTIDTTTGKTKPMIALLDERAAIRDMENSISPLTPKQIETIVGIFLGALAVLLFFSGIGFFMIKRAEVSAAANAKNAVAAASAIAAVTPPAWVFQLPSSISIALLFCLVGIFIGTLVR